MDRRELFKGAIAGTFALWAAPVFRAVQQGAPVEVRKLTETLAVLVAGGSNVVAFSAAEGLVLADTGAAGTGNALSAALTGFAPNRKVRTVFNTHYHLDHTGNNETFSAAGAKIIAHDRTRQWMSNDYWLPDQDRYEKARPKAAWPTESFFDKGSMDAGGEHIESSYLTMAHTRGDIYV